ncbi:MAG: hypothetical protein JJW01_00990 [Alphaproteobacteria bacterium]|nr:hypothetical protein [Rickettsiales bacterium]
MKIAFSLCQIIDIQRFGGAVKVQKLLSAFVFPNNNMEIPVKLTKENKETKWYFPRVSLVKSANAIDGEHVFFKIECSL